MYAFVQFLHDKMKAIVPLCDIKSFDVDAFDANDYHTYEVFWTSSTGENSGYSYAVILLVAETLELIENRKKRVKCPSSKKLDELLASAENNEKNSDEEAERKSKENSPNFEKQKLKVSNTELLHNSKTGEVSSLSKVRKRFLSSGSDSPDEDEIILKSELKRVKDDYDKVNQKLKEEIEQLKKKNNQLQELNLSLQMQLLDASKRIEGLKQNTLSSITKLNSLQEKEVENEKGLKQNTPESIRKLNSLQEKEVENESPPEVLEIFSSIKVGTSNAKSTVQEAPLQKGSGNVLMVDISVEEKENPSSSSLTNRQFNHDTGTPMKWVNDQVELAPGVHLSKDQWSRVTAGKNLNESKIVCNLAELLWDSETILERSVTGSPFRRFIKDGIKSKKPLSPHKVEAVQNGLRFWLREQGKQQQEIHKLSTTIAVRRMLSNKIMDLTKQHKMKLSLSQS